MIVMPNTLHFLNPCLTRIPDDVNLVLILNGTKRWEEKYLFSYFADSKAVIDNMPDSMSALQFIAQMNQLISKLNKSTIH
jgi:hypothetical protein